MNRRWLLIVLVLPVLIGVLALLAQQLQGFGLAPGTLFFFAPLTVLTVASMGRARQREITLNNRQTVVTALIFIVGLAIVIAAQAFSSLDIALAVGSMIAIFLLLGVPYARLLIAVPVLAIIGGVVLQSGLSVQLSPTQSFLLGTSLTLVALILVIGIVNERNQQVVVQERLARYENLDTFDSLLDEEAVIPETRLRPTLSDFFSEPRFATNLRHLLGRANVQITAAEYIALYLVSASLFYTVAYFIVFPASDVIAAIAGVIGFFIPTFWIRYQAGRRLISFYNQLPATIAYLGNAVGQGLNSLQAMEGLSLSAPQPTAEEFRRVVAEQTMGIQTDDAIDHMLERMPLRDLEITFQSMRIQTRRGGNIARLLGVANDMVIARTSLFFTVGQYKRWKARLPFMLLCVIVAVQWVLFPAYWEPLWQSPQGQLGLALTYGLFIVMMLVIGHSRRRLRGIQRRIGFAAIADLEVVFEMFGGAALLMALGVLGVPFVIVMLLGLLLIQMVLGISFVGIVASVGLMSILAVFEPQFFPDLSTALFGEIRLPDFSSFILDTPTASALVPVVQTGAPFVLPPIVLIFGFLFLLVLSALIYIGMRVDLGRDPLQDRLAQYGERELPNSLSEVELTMSFRDRVLIPMFQWIGQRLAWFSPQMQVENALKLLDSSGLRSGPFTLILLRILSLLLGFLGSLYLGRVFLTPQSGTFVLLIGVGIAVGFLLPTRLIQWRIRRRSRKISEELPEVLTLLNMYLSAGVSLDRSMLGIFEEMDGIIALGFGRVLREVSLGKLRHHALIDMANRLSHPQLTALIANLLVNTGVNDRELPRLTQEMTQQERTRWVNNTHASMVYYGEIIDNVWQIGFVVFLMVWLLIPLIEFPAS